MKSKLANTILLILGYPEGDQAKEQASLINHHNLRLPDTHPPHYSTLHQIASLFFRRKLP
jgi:hypothetical protein